MLYKCPICNDESYKEHTEEDCLIKIREDYEAYKKDEEENYIHRLFSLDKWFEEKTIKTKQIYESNRLKS